MGVSAPARPPRAHKQRNAAIIGGTFVALILLFGSVIVNRNVNARAEKERQQRAEAESVRRAEEADRAKQAEEIATKHALTAKARDVFEPLYLSVKKIRTATGVGVTYVRYGDLFADVHLRESVITDLLKSPTWPSQFTAISAAYVIAIFNYAEALDVWRRKIESGSEFSEIVRPGESSLVDMVTKRHSIEPISREGDRFYGVSMILGKIWADAAREVDSADELYLRAIGEREEPPTRKF